MMHTISKNIIALVVVGALLTHAPCAHANNTFGKPFFASRSQGNNLARRIVGEARELLACKAKGKNSVLSITPELSKNFNTDSLGTYFSLRSSERINSNNMDFRGSKALNPPFSPTNTDVVAENFALASNFSSMAKLNPHIENFITDVNFRFNWYNRVPGLYFEIGIPVVWTRSYVELTEGIPSSAGNNISILASNNPVNGPYVTQPHLFSITEAYKGLPKSQEYTFTSPGLAPIDITIDNLAFARIDGKKSKAGIADVELVAGYNILCKEKYHLAINARVTIPTGNRPEAVYVFEPIVGNGHHLQAGGGLSAHANVWNNGCDRSWSIWFDSALYYAFSTKQTRTFDFKGNGVGSRYLLFKKFNEAGNFENRFIPGPNISTLGAKVTIGMIGQAVLMADYRRGGLTVDFGYSIWGRDKEKIKITDEVEQSTYGIWGGTPIDNLIAGGANRTNSQTTINGVNFVTSSNNVFDMPSPHTISGNSIDVASAESPAAIAHKLFTHVSYAWHRQHCTPFIGIGGEIELSGRQNNALNQWGIWSKLGMAFF